jgi:hypothetical protein
VIKEPFHLSSDKTLPKRKLEFFSMSKNILATTYLTGGVGEEEHILLIKFEDKRIVDMAFIAATNGSLIGIGLFIGVHITKRDPESISIVSFI